MDIQDCLKTPSQLPDWSSLGPVDIALKSAYSLVLSIAYALFVVLEIHNFLSTMNFYINYLPV